MSNLEGNAERRSKIADLRGQISAEKARRQEALAEKQAAAEAATLDAEITRLERELESEKAQNENLGLVAITAPNAAPEADKSTSTPNPPVVVPAKPVDADANREVI